MLGDKTRADRMLVPCEVGTGYLWWWGNSHHQPQVRAVQNQKRLPHSTLGFQIERKTTDQFKGYRGGSSAQQVMTPHAFQGRLPFWDSPNYPRLWVSSLRVTLISGHLTAELSLESYLLLPRLNNFVKIILLEPDYIWEFIPFTTDGWIETQIKGPAGLFFRAPAHKAW